jgi:hypothetical protein
MTETIKIRLRFPEDGPLARVSWAQLAPHVETGVETGSGRAFVRFLADPTLRVFDRELLTAEKGARVDAVLRQLGVLAA